jgi:RNA polymerase sigma factor for flagellar operon FliA
MRLVQNRSFSPRDSGTVSLDGLTACPRPGAAARVSPDFLHFASLCFVQPSAVAPLACGEWVIPLRSRRRRERARSTFRAPNTTGRKEPKQIKRNDSAEHRPSNTTKTRITASTTPNREELIVGAMPLVHSAAKHLARRLPPCVTLDELTSAGTVGLIKAADRFDVNRGLLFATYAKHRVLGEMLDYLRAEDPLSRAQRHARRERDGEVEAAPFVPTTVPPATAQPPVDYLLRAHVLTARQSLSINENRVIELTFYAGWNNREIAQTMGVTESRISQLRTSALSKLRTRLATQTKGAAA